MSLDGTSRPRRYSVRPSAGGSRRRNSHKGRGKRPRRWILILVAIAGLSVAGVGLYIASRTVQVKDDLTSAASILPQIRTQLAAGNAPEAQILLGKVQAHTQAAREVVEDPLWKISSQIPLVGQNFEAVGEVAQVADFVVSSAGNPILDAVSMVESGALSPKDGALDLDGLERLSPNISTVSETTRQATSRLEALDTTKLAPEISRPLNDVRATLEGLVGPLDVATEFAQMAPDLLGAHEQRNYLLLFQNNAELRATGGLSGALAVLRVEHGKVELASQATATELGKFVPHIPVDPEQEQIFSSKLGSQVSGVNLTPDFPTAAQTAKSMWEKRYGTAIDGVIALDPVVLSHLLKVTGPLSIDASSGAPPQNNKPMTLTAENVTKILLSEVYSSMGYEEQDQFFAAVAQRVFEALTSGKAAGLPLFQALSDSSDENRLHAWSRRASEQQLLSSIRIGGSMTSGPDAGPGSFGVFFNDGTGSKMDYYTRHSVRLVEECGRAENQQTIVRVSISSTAPEDASTSLPAGVTGGGFYGVPAGLVQTNIVIYGPPGASVESANVDGTKTDFAPYFHASRPVGVVATRLAPGEGHVVELKFANTGSPLKSHLLVTPTVQDVKDVILPSDNCETR